MDLEVIVQAAGFARRLLEVLLLPPGGPIVVALAGLALARFTRLRRAGAAVAVAGLLSAWLLCTPWVAGAITYWVERGSPPALADDDLRRALAGPSPPGAIVVLAGGMQSNRAERPFEETPNGRSLKRLAQGAALARASGLPLLLSGGPPRNRETAEARAMERSLERSFGQRARWVEEKSPTTAGNAREVARILRDAGVRRIVLVTQAYHMPRAKAAFEAAGLDVLAAPHDFSGSLDVEGAFDFLPAAGATVLAWEAAHELVGWHWYRLVGALR